MFSDTRWLTWGILFTSLSNKGGEQNIAHSFDVTSCPGELYIQKVIVFNVYSFRGYVLDALQQTNTGLVAQLTLHGAACNAFRNDISELTIEVTYETTSRLHVNIFDTANGQYTLPQSVIEHPLPPTQSFEETSDLLFNYQSSPFAFWIMRRAEPDAIPLFDTRITSLPQTLIPPFISGDQSLALNGFPLVFEDQFLQLASALPRNTNIYDLGEVIASSGFRRNIGPDGGTIQTLWARGAADPVDENLYGTHPVYLEHRFDLSTNTSQSHGVLLLSAAGGDVILTTPPSSNVSIIEYRMIGGVLDFYFFSGLTPNAVIKQYGELIGFPTWQPVWGFGFHLCRWGHKSIADVKEQVSSMRAANIPLEAIWNDIELYHAFRDFTTDPVSFPTNDTKAFIFELNANHQHYIPIVDAAIAKTVNSTDHYKPYLKGVEKGVFVKNPDGSEHVGKLWPGYTVYTDWFQSKAQKWWMESLRDWYESGIEYSGLWLDKNEPTQFCDGSCGTGANLTDIEERVPSPLILSGMAAFQRLQLITFLPNNNSYNSTIFGPSGNITINGTITCLPDVSPRASPSKARRPGTKKQLSSDAKSPLYAIHNGNGRLEYHSLALNATHAGGAVELDVHNLWGLMEEKATHWAFQKILPNKRPFLISRSTFPSSGKWTGHWLGDNYSLWSYLRYDIASVLQFQIFQIPFVGPDACGFNGNTDEELCNRWMQLAAFFPFFRNHNVREALPQEPYRWDSVAEASRKAIAIRYSLLPYWYTLFANSSMNGAPPFLVGRDILVTPVLEPNVSFVSGIFPGRGNVIWRDWYTHDMVKATPSQHTTLSAPLGHINVHIRDGSAILRHTSPAYTIEETRRGPYFLLVSLTSEGIARGTAYVDDGISYPPGPNRILGFGVARNELTISGEGSFLVEQRLEEVTILGVGSKPRSVAVNGEVTKEWTYAPENGELVLGGLRADLNGPLSLKWY
ncbi:glycoside hydrolase family 31 protein [Gymnopilus junonius]|uniref:Glycoside hydrolase family 31 protein n=1 Tax=Gymnopilus junonius TaxID=109634 RepID=A0A9P5NCS3_GYMJU|nr:glycoside hydrolase family 31 protein [Gymnopilus junonius]